MTTKSSWLTESTIKSVNFESMNEVEFINFVYNDGLMEILTNEYNYSSVQECYSSSQKDFISEIIDHVFKLNKKIRFYIIDLIRNKLFKRYPDDLRIFIGKNGELVINIEFDIFNLSDYAGCVMEVYTTNNIERSAVLFDLSLEKIKLNGNYLL